MTDIRGAEDARSHLPELLSAAERGRSTLITRRGRAVAVLAPADALDGLQRQGSLLTLAGTGAGLWGPDSAAGLGDLRDEWER